MACQGDSPLERYLRAVHFLAGAQIYLKDNVLLRDPLRPEHIKDRLLGHWGTTRGINLIHAHLNRAILERDLNVLLITGPGHGAPANLANLYLEGTLGEFYPEMTQDEGGLHRFIKAFSWPGGFPSHLYPGIPGVIHEGGELGYALATAFGAAFDNPDVLVPCIVGDGEAETGPTAAAWHCPKFLDPAESGAVLPILHVNGYKISNPTISGSMSDEELTDLYCGYGWHPLLADPNTFAEALDQALDLIDVIQKEARASRSSDQAATSQATWPMIVLRSPKGWTGVKEMDGKPIEGSFRAHQVPVPGPKANPEHLKLVEDWLRSYRPEELFDADGAPMPDILACCPSGDKRIGRCLHAYGGKIRQPLVRPQLSAFAGQVDDGPGQSDLSPAEAVGRYLAKVVAGNPKSFRIFSPDELVSNKLEGVFEAPTQRDYQWPVEGRGHSEDVGPHGGRVLEILSEHTCQAWLQGYLLTGRHGLFPSYEAFLNIIVSMMDQFAKFLKMSAEFSWRAPVSSLTYLETSTLWRQEHNGFSHQSPGFINALLNKKKDITRVYLPPDANCLLATMAHCLGGTNHVNLIIANKHASPVWLSMDEAIAHCRAGAGIWHWASTDQGIDPDVVLVGIGDIVTHEVLAAADILRQEIPELGVRVVNVTDLLILDRESEHPHGLHDDMFQALFTLDRPVIVNFHGYPSAVEQLLFGREVGLRFKINGYGEEGTTTTPFDMLVRNGTSRYHLVTQAVRLAAGRNPKVAVHATAHVERYEYLLRDFGARIRQDGKDPDEITQWRWPGTDSRL